MLYLDIQQIKVVSFYLEEGLLPYF